ncbi:hypothetical protein PG990_006180 [Apiospora arundinis]|jgi:hypothetical protein|uniref:Uncharacterized protein n=1 Tax=Apiospora arundinis TaxID=335852 RepID=A0ABR2J9G1_9PEZI
MPTAKPKLAQLKTPVTATFPSELSALSARTPVSAVPDFIKEEYTKTPISPPMAYMDFLKAMSIPSPVIPEKRPGSSSEEDDEVDDSGVVDSMPSTASSEQTDCSCKCGNHESAASSPYPTHPMSAPPTGATSFPSLLVPPSPSLSTLESPMSATVRSPFSARSVRSPFDWEAALKSRYAQDSKATKSSSSNGRSVRHIREVVTRTVTYTPRMSPAPKGKRRRTECPKSLATSQAITRAQAAAAGTSVPSPPLLTTRANSA